MLDSLLQSLPNATPWGLTVGQTLGIVVIAAVLLGGWFIVRIVTQLSGCLFRAGCAVLVVFICGIISYMAILNLSTTPPR